MGRDSLQFYSEPDTDEQVGAPILIVLMWRFIKILFCIFEEISFEFEDGILASLAQSIVNKDNFLTWLMLLEDLL